jgi:hypothetical protein
MKKRIFIALVLGAVLSLVIGSSAAFAHTHMHLPNGNCINLPADAYADTGGPSDNPDNEAQHAHHGIGTAKAHNGVFDGGLCPWE